MNFSTAIFIPIIICLITLPLHCQTISGSIPENVDKSKKYLFYLHGRIIQDQDPHAMSPEYGPYEYLAILDTLSRIEIWRAFQPDHVNY